jgi:transposase-like protein
MVKKKSFERQSLEGQSTFLETFSKSNAEEKCIKHFESLRWPGGLSCERCFSKRVMSFKAKSKAGKSRNLYECVDCGYQYSVTTGTMIHGTHLPLTKWFLAVYIICSAPKRVSAKDLQRKLKTSYKTAWKMKRSIQYAMLQYIGFYKKSENYKLGETEILDLMNKVLIMLLSVWINDVRHSSRDIQLKKTAELLAIFKKEVIAI